MKVFHFGLLLLISAIPISSAEAASAKAALRSACMADAKRLCGHVLSDPKARMACMRANRSKLSSGCQAVRNKVRNAALDACKKRLMPTVKGLGRDKARAKIRSCVMREVQKR